MSKPKLTMEQRMDFVCKTLRMTQEEIEEVRESFNLFDKDGNGHITVQELATVMQNLGQNPSQTELKEMIDELDVDKNGVLDFNEFLAMYSRKTKGVGAGSEEDEMKAAFKTFDRNGDGFISAKELRHVMLCLGENLSEEEVVEMIKSADMDGNGKIDYEEFSKVLCKKL